MTIRIFIADDRELIRAGVRSFAQGSDIEVIGECSLGETAKLEEARCDAEVVLLGIEPQATDRLEMVKRWHSTLQPPRVLLYSACKSAELISRALADGASGLVSHAADRDTFLHGVRGVARGEAFWSREDLRRAGSASRLTNADLDVQLTRREYDVMAKLVEGLTNKQIAQKLDISYETVKEHVQHVLRKIGVTDRTQAAVWAVRNRIG